MKKLLLSVLSLLLLTSCAGSNYSHNNTLAKTPEDQNAKLLDFYRNGTISYDTNAPDVTDVSDTLKEISFYRDGKKTSGRMYLPEGSGPFPTVIISGEYYAPMTDYEEEALQFAENGCAAVLFDFIYSESNENNDQDGDLSLFSEVSDLCAVLDSLLYLPEADGDNVFLWGHSFGGLVSTYVGCRRVPKVKGLILAEPSFEMYDIYDMMPKFNKDVLIIAGTQDCTGESGFEEAMKHLQSARIVTIEGADHGFNGEYGKMAVEESVKFISKHIN